MNKTSIKNRSFFFNNKKEIKSQLSHRKSSPKFNLLKNKNLVNNEYIYSDGHSMEIFQNKTKKLMQKYNLRIDKRNNIRKSTILASRCTYLNKLEKNIKDAINNMKKDIEKKNIHMTNSISPNIIRNKIFSSPNLKIFCKSTLLSFFVFSL